MELYVPPTFGPQAHDLVMDAESDVELDLQKVAEHGGDALVAAASSGRVAAIKRLLETWIPPANGLDKAYLASVYHGHADAMHLLLESGADMRMQDDLALIVASQRGHMDIVRTLASPGADARSQGSKSLMVACLQGNLAIVKLLVQRGALVRDQSEIALVKAATGGSVEVIRYLLARGLRLRVWDACSISACAGNAEAVALLLPYVNSNIGDIFRRACMSSNVETVKLVYARVMSHTDHRSIANLLSSSLDKAASLGHVEMVRLLFDKGAHMTVYTLSRAAVCEDDAIFKMLMARFCESVPRTQPMEIEAFRAASRAGSVVYIERLLDAGMTMPDDYVDHVVDMGIRALERLRQRGLVVSDANTAMSTAVRYGRRDILEWLIRHGASVSEGGEMAMRDALGSRNLEIIELLLSHGVTTSTPEMRTSLRNAGDEFRASVKALQLTARREERRGRKRPLEDNEDNICIINLEMPGRGAAYRLCKNAVRRHVISVKMAKGDWIRKCPVCFYPVDAAEVYYNQKNPPKEA